MLDNSPAQSEAFIIARKIVEDILNSNNRIDFINSLNVLIGLLEEVEFDIVPEAEFKSMLDTLEYVKQNLEPNQLWNIQMQARNFGVKLDFDYIRENLYGTKVTKLRALQLKIIQLFAINRIES